VVRVLLVVLVFAVGCGGKMRAHKPGEIWLASIVVKGNKSIEEDDLIPGLALDRSRRDGRAVDPYQLSLDTKRIRGAYQRIGFFDVKVDAQINREDNAETVVFTVVEGPRVKARVVIDGLPPEIPKERALAKLELKDGDPWDYELYDDGKEVVKALIEEAGYPHVEVDESVVTVDRAAGVAVASYRIVITGPRATFGDVKILGLDDGSILDAAIRGRLTFATGDSYSPRALAETERSLFELGRFSQIRIDPDRSKLGPIVPVTITVTLASRHEVKLGGGLGYEPLTYEARVRAGASYVPADYPLWTFSVDSRLAATVDHSFADFEPKIRILGTAQRLEMFRPRLIGELGIGFDFFTVEAYTATGPLLRLGASTPLGVRWLTLQAGWSFTYLSFTDLDRVLDPAFPDPANPDPVTAIRRAQLGLNRNQRLGRFEQTIAADLRDNPLEPRRGGFISLRVTEGTPLAGGAFSYLQLQPDLRAYVPLGRMVLAFRLRYGTILGDVPVTERLFSGGAQNHRGFSARALAPVETRVVNEVGTISVLIGGESFLEAGAELRVPLGELGPFLVGSTLFLDGGDVPNDGDDLDPFNLHWAAGFGMFLKYGAFKIRFDLGHRLNRTTTDDFVENTLLFLGVGETY